MTRRPFSALTGESFAAVEWSQTGRKNHAYRRSVAAYYADRALLLFTFIWLFIRVDNYATISSRPDVLYQPTTWLAHLILPNPMPEAMFYGLVALGALCVLVCLFKAQLILARAALALILVFAILPEFGYGKVDHINHLFLLAHVYAIFLPIEFPQTLDKAVLQVQAINWYQLGLLSTYTMVGLWKIAEMTIRDVIKPGMTWLHPDALVVTSITAMRNYDLPLTIPAYLETVKWLVPIGYVLIALIFSVSFLATYRRPLMLIILPSILVFHLLNMTHYVLFISTCFVASIMFFPYDLFLGDRSPVAPIRAVHFEGRRDQARYERQYANGDRDTFRGFYAYREWLKDVSIWLAAPLYYPGVAWSVSRILSIARAK